MEAIVLIFTIGVAGIIFWEFLQGSGLRLREKIIFGVFMGIVFAVLWLGLHIALQMGVKP